MMIQKLNRNKKSIYFLTPVITIIWLLVIYYIKGIFPFGEGTIIDYDLYKGGVPNFFYLWDAFHGGNIVYDLTTACGFERNVLMSLLNPSYWFLLLIKREMIVDAISILLIIKFAVISLTSSYAFSKIFDKLPPHWLITVSFMYTFCGYNMQYFTNIDWLDAVAIYPLIILFALNMFKGKSKLPYFAALTYLLIFNTYMAFFVVISLVVFGGLYIFIIADKENRSKYIYSLGMGTLASLFGSGYFVFGFVRNSVGSARFNYLASVGYTSYNSLTSPSLIDILSFKGEIDIAAVFMFFGIELALACLCVMLIKSVKNKDLRKYVLFFALSISFLGLQVFCAATDLLWHAGSHVMFPMRNGYMAGFFCCLIIAFFASNEDCSKGFSFKRDIFNCLPFIFAVFSVIFVYPYGQIFYSTFSSYNVLSATALQRAMYFPYLNFALFSIIPIFFLQCIKYKKFRETVTILAVTVFFAVNSVILIGNEHDSEKTTDYKGYYADCFDAFEGTESDIFNKANNPDLSLITNYPYFTNQTALSNWTHTLSGDEITTIKNLGFAQIYTRTLDSGGTQFSRALLGITHSVSKADLDETFYEQIGTTERGFKQYKDLYTLPVGIIADESIKTVLFDDYENTFEYQNAVYSAISGNESELFTKAILTETNSNVISEKDFYNEYKPDTFSGLVAVNKNVTVFSGNINFEKENSLYLIAKDTQFLLMTVNDIPIQVYSCTETGNGEILFNFPQDFNNNVLYLGTYCDNVEIKIYFEEGSKKDVSLYLMDTEKFISLCEGSDSTSTYFVNKNQISMQVNAKNDGILFLPMSYSENRSCTVDGKAAESIKILGNLTGVRVSEGTHNIQFEYSNFAILKILLFGIIGLGLGLVVLVLDRKIKKIPKAIYAVCCVAFGGICAGAYFMLYVIPLFFKIFIIKT